MILYIQYRINLYDSLFIAKSNMKEIPEKHSDFFNRN